MFTVDRERWYRAAEQLLLPHEKRGDCFYCFGTGDDPEAKDAESIRVPRYLEDDMRWRLKHYLGNPVNDPVLLRVKHDFNAMLQNEGYHLHEAFVTADDDDSGRIHLRIGTKLCPVCRDGRKRDKLKYTDALQGYVARYRESVERETHVTEDT